MRAPYDVRLLREALAAAKPVARDTEGEGLLETTRRDVPEFPTASSPWPRADAAKARRTRRAQRER